MSWFKRTPKIKEPAKLIPHVSSPMTQQHLIETKIKVKPLKEKQPKNK